MAALVITIVVCELLARLVVGNVPPEIRWYDAAAQQRVTMMDAVDDSAPVSVVFAGTSAAWQAFVPAYYDPVTGSRSMNVGLAGAVPVVMGPWLTDVVQPRLQPELVVWGLTPLDFAPEYGAAQTAAYSGAVETAPGWLAGFDRSASQVSTLVSSRRILRSPAALVGSQADERSEGLERAVAATGAGGERIDFQPAVDAQRRAIQRARFTNFDIDQADRTAIIDSVRSLQRNGVEVVLVELPLSQRLRSTLPDPAADVAKTSQAIVELGAELQIDVIAMPDVLGDSNFVDFTHVDQLGAQQVTAWLASAVLSRADIDPGECTQIAAFDDFGFAVPVTTCRFSE